MKKKNVKITIAGINYFINTDETKEYTQKLGKMIDERITKILTSSSFVTMNQAAILVALELADEIEKGKGTDDNFRSQIAEYLEEATKAKAERDRYKAELETLKAEKSLKNEQIDLFAKKDKKDKDE